MESVLATLAIVVITASVSKGGVVKRESEIEDNGFNVCGVHIYLACMVPNVQQYQNDLATQDARIALLGNRQRLGEFAEALQTAASCIETQQAASVCAGASEEETGVAEIQFVAGYLSSPARVDIVHGTAGSPCLTNFSKVDQLGEESLQCLQNATEAAVESDEVCAGIQMLRECSVDAGTSVCGLSVGVFFHSLWEYSSQPNVDASVLFSIIPDENMASVVQSCNQLIPEGHSYTKRAMSFFGKFF
ncbi:hypothetical protein RRG08_027014 [Elysia crispata]|uniref:Uncharacterized protein n=1 Tax=Elysia crispata TaxID=231223 RepID=A0AAE1DZR2_9GAST|nr:hypothetical protein RRG08_027014 [Elysia crispata]